MAESKARINRQTVDLSEFPDVVVVYLGMRVQQVRGLGKLLQTGRQIQGGVGQGPDGLLLHENLLFSLVPPHVGMRQYWRDLDSLERWTRDLPHKQWWQDFLRDSAGTGFWHETYFMRGGMEAIYDDIRKPTGGRTERLGATSTAGDRAHGPWPNGESLQVRTRQAEEGGMESDPGCAPRWNAASASARCICANPRRGSRRCAGRAR